MSLAAWGQGRGVLEGDSILGKSSNTIRAELQASNL